MQVVAGNEEEQGSGFWSSDFSGIGLEAKLDQVYIFGAGLVRKQAVDATIYHYNIERYNDHSANQGPASIAVLVEKAAIWYEDLIDHYFAFDNRLREATRQDFSLTVDPKNVLCNIRYSCYE